MQFSAALAVAALATAASAWSNGTVVYTTDIVTAYTTVCPASTQVTFNGVTYTATESTTLTITNCPCTIVKPVTTSSVVYCNTCSVPTSAPVYANSTTAAASTVPVVPTTSVGTTSAKSSATATPSTISASGADRAVAFSGFSLAGLLAVAAYIL